MGAKLELTSSTRAQCDSTAAGSQKNLKWTWKDIRNSLFSESLMYFRVKQDIEKRKECGAGLDFIHGELIGSWNVISKWHAVGGEEPKKVISDFQVITIWWKITKAFLFGITVTDESSAIWPRTRCIRQAKRDNFDLILTWVYTLARYNHPTSNKRTEQTYMGFDGSAWCPGGLTTAKPFWNMETNMSLTRHLPAASHAEMMFSAKCFNKRPTTVNLSNKDTSVKHSLEHSLLLMTRNWTTQKQSCCLSVWFVPFASSVLIAKA